MAKRLLLNLLIDNLSEYVDGLSQENMKMGVWSGELEFLNLKLKPMALAKLDLPLSVHNASLKNVRLVIPWTNLGQSPCTLFVDGVYAQVGPLDFASLSEKELQERSLDLKRKLLQQAETFAMDAALALLEGEQAALPNKGGGSDGKEGDAGKKKTSSLYLYLQRLFAKVVANIEVKIQNIHLRYEDVSTIPGTTLAAGVTIDEIGIVTTDESWVEKSQPAASTSTHSSHSSAAPSSTPHHHHVGPMYKIAQMKNFGVYWHTNSSPLGKESMPRWEQAMASFVYKHDLGDVQIANEQISALFKRHYIWAPPNCISIKLVHNEGISSSGRDPKLDFTVELSHLSFSLDQMQLMQLCLVLDAFAIKERQKLLFLFRPAERPTKDPRGWWIYAFRLITGRDDIVFDSAATNMDLCIEHRDRYTTLLKRNFDKSKDWQHEAFLTSSVSGTESVKRAGLLDGIGAVGWGASTSDIAEIARIEAILPLQALIVYRQLAVREVVSAANAKHRKALLKSKKVQNPDGGASGTKTSRLTKMKNFFMYGTTTPAPRNEKSASSAPPSPEHHHGGGGGGGGASKGETAPPAAKEKRRSIFSRMFGSKTKDTNASVAAVREGRSSSVDSHYDDDGGGSTDGKPEEGDFSLDSLRERFESDNFWDDIEKDGSAGGGGMWNDVLLLRVTATGTLSVRFATEFVPIVDATLAISAKAKMRSSSDVHLRGAITEMFVKDRITEKPARPSLVSFIEEGKELAESADESSSSSSRSVSAMLNDDSTRSRGSIADTSSPTLSVNEKLVVIYDNNGLGKSTLRVTALPLELVWSAPCITKIVDMFITPLSQLSPWPTLPMATYHLFGGGPETASTSSASAASTASTDETGVAKLEMVIEMEAPKIVIPESGKSADRGFIVLDMGKANFRATYDYVRSTFSWRLQLTSLCAGTPILQSDVFSYGEKGMYLVRPFNISASQLISRPAAVLSPPPALASDASSSRTMRSDSSSSASSLKNLPPPPTPGVSIAEIAISIQAELSLQVLVNATKLDRVVGVVQQLVLDINEIKRIATRADRRKARRTFDEVSELQSEFATISEELTSETPKNSVLRIFEALLEEHTLVEQLTQEFVASLRARAAEMNPHRVWLEVQFSLPQINVEVTYISMRSNEREPKQETITIALEQSRGQISTRVFDTTMVFSLGSIRIQDSLRPLTQQLILRSEPETVCDVIKVTVVQIFNKYSPYFKGQGLEVFLAIEKLILSLDANTILHAFAVSQVLVERLKPKVDEVVHGVKASRKSAREKNETEEEKMSRSTSDAGMKKSTSKPSPLAADASLSRTSSKSSIEEDFTKVLNSFDTDDDDDSNNNDHTGVDGGSSETLAAGSDPSPSRNDSRKDSRKDKTKTYKPPHIQVGMARKSRRSLTSTLHLEFQLIQLTSTSLSIEVFKSSDDEESASSPELDPVCALEFKAITACMNALTLTTANLLVSSIDLIDARRVAEHHAFRKIVTSSKYEDRSGGSSTRDGADSVGSTASRSYNQQPFLEIMFEEETTSNNKLDIVFKNLLATIALDSIIDIGNVAVNIVFAILTIITPPDGEAIFREFDTDDELSDTSEISDDEFGTDIEVEHMSPQDTQMHTQQYQSRKQQLRASSSNRAAAASSSSSSSLSNLHHNKCSSWHIWIKVPSPSILFLDDPVLSDSRALLMTCTIDVHCNNDNWGGALKEMQEALHVTAQNIQLFALDHAQDWISGGGLRSHSSHRSHHQQRHNNSRSRERSVCDKFSVDLHATRRLEKGIVLAANLTFNMSDIQAVLSLDNIHLVDSILSRRTLTGLAPPKLTDNITYCIFGARTGGDGSTQVDIYVMSFNLGTTTITAINDLSPHDGKVREADFEYPAILRIKFSGVSFHGDGALHPRILVDNISLRLEIDVHHIEGSGFLIASIEFYNSNVSLWEPVVEHWKPELTVKKEQQGMNIEMEAKRALQINLSGRNIDTLVNAYSLLLQRADSARSYVHSNSTRLFDSEHGEGGIDRERTRTISGAGAASASFAKQPSTSPFRNRRLSSILNERDFTACPSVIIRNSLMCDMKFRVWKQDVEYHRSGEAAMDQILEQGDLGSGCHHIVFVNPSERGNCLSIKVGNYDWSAYSVIGMERDALSTMDLTFQTPYEAGEDGSAPVLITSAPLTLSLFSTVVPDAIGGFAVVEMIVFSKSALIDRSGLKLCTKANRRRKKVIRNTFTPHSTTTTFASSSSSPSFPFSPLSPSSSDDTKLARVFSLCQETSSQEMETADCVKYVVANEDGLLIRRGISLSTDVVRRVPAGEFIYALPGSTTLGSDEGDSAGDVRVQLSDRSGWATMIFADGEKLLELADLMPSEAEGADGETSPQTTEPTSATSAPQIAFRIESFRVGSRRSYIVNPNCQVGSNVYTDREGLVWAHLPDIFTGQNYISTACDDFGAKSRDLIRFVVSRESMVFVLIDAESVLDKKSPLWLSSDGYRRVVGSCVARRSASNRLTEQHFVSWGKFFEAGEEVVLGGAEASGAGRLLYVVFVVNPRKVDLNADNTTAVISQVVRDTSLKQEEAKLNWVQGGNGLSFFHTDDDRFSIGVNSHSGSAGSSIWSDNLSLKIPQGIKDTFEIINDTNGRAYQLVYSVSPLSGLFNRTQMVTVTPHYCIINCMDEPLEVRQQGVGIKELLYIEPFRSCAWHKTDYRGNTKIHLRSQSSQWSYGCVDINEVGSSVLLLPTIDWFAASSNHDAVVAHVEVKLAEDKDNCAVVVVVWRASRERGSMVSVKNDSDLPITIQQAGVFVAPGSEPPVLGNSVVNTASAPKTGFEEDEARFNVCVAPGVWQPFGWADPILAPIVTITIGTPPHGPVKICTTIGLLKLNAVTKLYVSEKCVPIKGRKSEKRRSEKVSSSSSIGGSTSDNDDSTSEVFGGGGGGAGARRRRRRAAQQQKQEQSQPHAYEVYIAVQALGSGRVIRIVREEADLSNSVKISNDGDGGKDEGPAISRTATGAMVGGVVVGSIILGPIAGALLAGAGIYAVSRTVRKQAAAARKLEKLRSAMIEEKARKAHMVGNSSSSFAANEEGALQIVGEDQATDDAAGIQSSNSSSGDGAESAAEQEQMYRSARASELEKDFTKITADYSASVSFRFAAISFSLTVEKPIRREFLSLYIEDIKGNMKITATNRSFELFIKDLQLDTYSETAVNPVVLYTLRDEESEHEPLFQFIMVEESHPETATQHFKYIAMRLLEISVSLDSATLQLLLIDLGSDFSLVSREQALALQAPQRWVDEYNLNVLEDGLELVDIYRSQLAAQQEKVYIENLVIHPLKVTLSFTQTTLPRSKHESAIALSVGILSYIPAFATVDSVAIKINSFIVADAMESSQSLVTRIGTQCLRDLQSHLARLAGSLTLLGRPVGLARNIGSGVQAFFYEPYQGAMKSPSQLVVGLGKGTGSLLGGFAKGTLNSTASIVSTATAGISQGFSYFADDNFAQQRAYTRRRAQEAAKEGIASGLLEGGSAVISGFAAGIGGLFTTPVEQAMQDGPSGFITGLGMGIGGVVVRPLLGVTDGLNSVAQTVIVQTADKRRRIALRPARAYDCLLPPSAVLQLSETSESAAANGREANASSSSSTSTLSSSQTVALAGAATGSSNGRPAWLIEAMRFLVLTPLDVSAAHAQAYVLARSKKKGVLDAFVGFAAINKEGTPDVLNDAIILTLRGILWRRVVRERDEAAEANSPASSTSSASSPTSFTSTSGQDEEESPLLHIASLDDQDIDVEEEDAFHPESEHGGRQAIDAMSMPKVMPAILTARPPPLQHPDAASSNPKKKKAPKEDVLFFLWPDVSHCLMAGEEAVEIMTTTDVIFVPCSDRTHASALYSLFLKHAGRMRNASFMPPLHDVLRSFRGDATHNGDAHGGGFGIGGGDVGIAEPLSHRADNYNFGTASFGDESQRAKGVSSSGGSFFSLYSNSSNESSPRSTSAGAVPVNEEDKRLTSRDVVARAEHSLKELSAIFASSSFSSSSTHGSRHQHHQHQVSDSLSLQERAILHEPDGKWRRLDEIMHQLAVEWEGIHSGAGGRISRCTVCTIINGSVWPVQLLHSEMQYGKGISVLGGLGYTPESRTLQPGGSLIIFLWGDHPSLFNSGHAKALVSTTAFSATVSTRRVTIDSIYDSSAAPHSNKQQQQQAAAAAAAAERSAGGGGPSKISTQEWQRVEKVRFLEMTETDYWIKACIFIDEAVETR